VQILTPEQTKEPQVQSVIKFVQQSTSSTAQVSEVKKV